MQPADGVLSVTDLVQKTHSASTVLFRFQCRLNVLTDRPTYFTILPETLDAD
jgi:hypothetical protein